MPKHISLFGSEIANLNDKLFYSLVALFVFVLVSLPDMYKRTNKFTKTFNTTTNCPNSEGKFLHSILFFVVLYVITKLYERQRFGVSRNGHIVKYVFYATLLFFALSSSDSYVLSRKYLSVNLASENGCPNLNGVLLHGLIFLVIATLIMYFPRDPCPVNVLELYNNGFDRNCSALADKNSCLQNPNCGFCTSINRHETKTSCVIDNNNKKDHKPLFENCTTYEYGDTIFVSPDAKSLANPPAQPPPTNDQQSPPPVQQPIESQLSWLKMFGLGTVISPNPENVDKKSNIGNSKNENDSSVMSNNSVDFSYATNCEAHSGNNQSCLGNVNCVVCGDDCTEGDEFGPYNNADCKGKFMYKRPY